MALAETARLIAELTLDDKKFNAKRALGQIDKLETGMSRAGKGAGQLGAGFARAGAIVGAAAITGLGAAAKVAIDFEDAFQGVVKTVDEADLASAGLTFKDLEKSIREMATEMPIAATELAGIAEQAGALGIKAKDIEAFTRQVAILGSTTNVSTEEAATALGQLQNVIGLTGDEFDNFSAALVDLGNKGASTEAQILEIARRSGAAGKLFGIAKDETLGWAAAAANLGLNEELAGTALQNLFLKLMPKVSKGSKVLQTITGKTAKQIKKAFKDDAGGALEAFIGDLGKLPKDARLAAVQRLFGKGSGLTRLVLGLAESVETNLTPALDTSTEAWNEATAAQVEFDKRNKTVRSAITRLKNGLIESALVVGEGFAPALGRASEKLAEFLKQDSNKNALKALGEDIGKAIDDIDWREVLDGAKTFVGLMKTALGYAKLLFDAVNALPTEIKAAGLGLIGLNKLSGGLIGSGIGNVVGGLTETIIRSIGAQLPGVVGKAFVQPVFVTNWPAGGLPGAPVPGGKPPVGRPGGSPGVRAGGGAAVFVTLPMLQNGLDRVMAKIPKKTGNEVGGTIGPPLDKIDMGLVLTKNTIADTKARLAAAAAETTRETFRAGQFTSSATRAGAASVVGAIRSIPAPVIVNNIDISSTLVTRVSSTTSRTGDRSTSRDRNNRSGELR